MHTAALAALGLEGKWSYEAIEVSPEEFEARVRAMPARGLRRAPTSPSRTSWRRLRSPTSSSAAAVAIGAANTLSFANGRSQAENTDATGFLDALPEPPAGREALVLGAGGSARAVVWALVRAGASVAIWNRTPERAEALAAELGARAPGARPRGATGSLRMTST